MTKRFEFLVATTKKDNANFLNEMNISLPVVATNQHNVFDVISEENKLVLTTPTIGVGTNRNLGLELCEAEYGFIVDDDMVFYDNVEETLNNALEEHPDADVIIFNFDYMRDGEKIRDRMKNSQKINFFNCLNFGICCALVKISSIKQKNIRFTTYFGGGCKYSCGEDSLFYLDCIRNKLKVYTCSTSVGMNEYRESTWFKGFNEKFFYDKGAWVACAFPKIKHLIKWYFILRFKKETELSLKQIIMNINQGIKGFKHLDTYCD